VNTPASASTPERVLLRLDWQVIRRLDGLLQGDYRNLFYGYGVDFADLRKYQPEDDIRYIDWNVTARLNTPYVRQYVEDREFTAWFLLDISPSVDFGASENHKRKKLIDFVSTMARILTRNGNRVGAVIFGGRIERMIPAKSGSKQVLQLIHMLMSYSRPPGSGFTDLSILLNGALNAIKRRSLIFLVSDFISSPGWERPLNLLNQRHEVLAVQLWHPYEKQLPDIGPVYLHDAEIGEQLYLDTHDKKFQRRFAEAAQLRQAELDAAFQHAGVDVLSLSTEDELVRSIVRFAGMRRQRRR